MKQQTESKYAVPMYEDWLALLKSLPIGVSKVATMVPNIEQISLGQEIQLVVLIP